jgi:hypothetical protein
MNDAERLYQTIQQRLAEDGLLRSAVSRVRGEAALDRVEMGFHFWQNDTHMPSVVNTYVESLRGK